MADTPAALLDRALAEALAAVAPDRCLPPHVPPPPVGGRTLIVAAGKAAAGMAAAWASRCRCPVEGLVVVPRGQSAVLHLAHRAIPGLAVLEAGHPVPDAGSELAGRRALELAAAAGPADRFVFLVSGGASALLAVPAPGLTLADKQAVTAQLLASGAPIADINAVRRRLSAVKGGRLAAACGAGEMRVLAISDVPGDDLADIGSGPMSPPPVAEDAREILARHGCAGTATTRALLGGGGPPGPGRDDPAFGRVTARVIARGADAVAAAAAVVGAAGYGPVLLPEARGAAIDVAADHAGQVRALRAAGGRHALISGGETTVQVRHPGGRGGRNTAYLLALALALGPEAGVHGLAADTDGIDGTGPHAGARLAPDALARARAAGLDPAALLAADRSADCFGAFGDLLVTGPTGTNVSDLRILLVGA